MTQPSSIVPNHFPEVPPTTTRLAVVGEAPGADEVVAGEPFVGVSGRYLRAILAACGASTKQIFFGNVCQHQPPNNDIEKFDFDGPEVQDGITQLKRDIQDFCPNCILLLGRTAFRTARPDLCYPRKGGYHVPLSDWRGSVFTSGIFGGIKTVGTYHPAYILRSWNDSPFFKFDVARAVRLSQDATWQAPVRKGNLRPSLTEVLIFIDCVRRNHIPITFDIEGYPDVVGVTMVSIVPTLDPFQGIVIPFRVGGDYWSAEEEPLIWQAFAGLLADPSVPKTAHNCFYELFVLAWRHRCIINNLADDTMMAHWELYPDFAKADDETKQKVGATQKKRSLGICCSLYTEQPFYKDDRLSDDHDVKLNYNFLDSSVTAEVRNATRQQLGRVPASLAHYQFNLSIIPAYNYIMLRGCRFDAEKIAGLARVVEQEIADLNRQINQALMDRDVFDSFPVSKGKEKRRYLDGFNVKSSTQKCWLIYDHLQQKELKRWGRTGDEDALLHYYGKTKDPILQLVIRCVRKRTRLSDIGKLVPDSDGRIRSSYDPVGTNTGRLSSRASMAMRYTEAEGWENTGTNLQNQTKELRVGFIPDSPDYDFFQCDLAGADAWTVAAELSALGYPTMLEDLLFGIKPSLVLGIMINEHAQKRDPMIVNFMSREELKAKTRELKKFFDDNEGKIDPVSGRPLDWLYLCLKRVQHGSNYDMHAPRICELVFGDSDGTVDLAQKDAELYQHFYKMRYKTDARNNWIRKTLEATQCIVTSCGIRRQFFAIRDRRSIDDAIVREASAVNPQANTTYVTNYALRNLWYDPENRTSKGGLFVEPLIQVHDALAGQYPSRLRDFAGRKFRQWFTVPLTIQGVQVNIPVDCKYGPNWKDTKTSFT